MKKLVYNSFSIISHVVGNIATTMALSDPNLAPNAIAIGGLISAVLGGIDLNEEGNTIQNSIDNALTVFWESVSRKYQLTEACLEDLKSELMDKGVSSEDFVANAANNGIDKVLDTIILSILMKHRKELEESLRSITDSQIRLDALHIRYTSKAISEELVQAIQSAIADNDLIKILIRIEQNRKIEKAEHEQLKKQIDEKGDQIKKEIYNLKSFTIDSPISLTTIPPTIKLIGREKEIQEICILMRQHKIITLRADGGVGKTAVAAKIVNKVKDDVLADNSSCKHIAWITSSGNLEKDLTSLNIPSVINAQSIEEKYKAAFVFLQNVPTFLVIDNMDEPPTNEEVKALNTISGKTQILITSRAYFTDFEKYNLKDLDPESAMVLFYRHYLRNEKITLNQITKRDDGLYAKNIVEAATCNALFIELIGKMAYADHWELNTLWERLNKDVFGQNSKHIIRTIHGEGKLLDQIQKLYRVSILSDRQKDIMSFISLFPAEHTIFFDVFEWARFEDDEEDHLGTLQDRGWIDRNGRGYFIHKIVKGSVELQQDRLGFDENKYEKLITKLSAVDQYIPASMNYIEAKERFVVLETVGTLLVNNGSDKDNVLILLSKLAEKYYEQGDYEKALEYYNKVLTIIKKMGELENLKTMGMYNNIALVYTFKGDFVNAINYYNKTLVILKKLFGPDNMKTASVYNNMALVYSFEGDYRKAMEYFDHFLTICKKVGELENPRIIGTYNNIAKMYEFQNNYDKALEYYKKALEICEKVPEHLNTLSTYNNIAMMYETCGDSNKALECFEKALTISEKVLGIDHPDTAKTCGSIGLLLVKKQDYVMAMDFLNRALAILEKTQDKNYLGTKTIKKSLENIKKQLAN